MPKNRSANVCQFLKSDIEDEKMASKEYEIQSAQLSPADKWKLLEIAAEEKVHKQELQKIAQRYNCSIQ